MAFGVPSSGGGGDPCTAITPTTIAGSIIDYAPIDASSGASLASAAIIMQGLTAPATITGLTTGTTCRTLEIYNTSTIAERDLILSHEDVTSQAANRFELPSTTNWLIPPGGSVKLRYDTTLSRWRILNGTDTFFTFGVYMDAPQHEAFIEGHGQGANLDLGRANGTLGSPTPCANGDVLAQLNSYGYGSEFDSGTAFLMVRATEAYTTTTKGRSLELRSVPNGTVTGTGGLKIDQNRNVGIGNYGATAVPYAFTIAAGEFAHQGNKFGAFNATPIVQPAVSGSGTTAWTTLMTALVNLGLITNTSTPIGGVPNPTVEIIAASGAATPGYNVTVCQCTGGGEINNHITLADGSIDGQRHLFIVEGNAAGRLTPTNFANATYIAFPGGATKTGAAELVWLVTTGQWWLVGAPQTLTLV